MTLLCGAFIENNNLINNLLFSQNAAHATKLSLHIRGTTYAQKKPEQIKNRKHAITNKSRKKMRENKNV